jgi:Toprim domain
LVTRLDWSPAVRHHLEGHRIDLHLAQRVDVRSDRETVVYPVTTPRGESYERRRDLSDPKRRTIQPAGQPLCLIWFDGRPDPGDDVLLAEGESDALAALSHLNGSAIKVGAIPGVVTPVEQVAGELGHCRRVYLALDDDQPGRAATIRFAEVLRTLVEVRFLRLDGGDLSDALVGADDPAAWLKAAIEEAPERFQTSEEELRAAGGYGVSSGKTEFPPAPEPLREAAFHGLAGEFVRTVDPHTEADPAATLIQLLAAFGNACGRGTGFRVEATEHGTNEFVGIVGATSKARKGTAWDRCRGLMGLADPIWAATCISSGIASGEGLIHAVRDPIVTRRKARKGERADVDGRIEDEVDPGVEDKRLLVVEAELAQVLRVMQRERSTVSPILRDLWDSGNARNMSKGSPERTTGSLVTLIGHVTARELRQELTDIEVGNGFGNRWLWVYAQRSKLLPRGGSLTDADLQPIAAKVAEALLLARTRRMLDFTDEAGEVWDAAYGDLSETTDDLLGAVTARAEAHVRRLAVLYALLDGADVVDLNHLRAALAVWDYCEASAAHIFGGKVGDPLADKILPAIQEAGETGLTRTDIRATVGGHVPGEDIDTTLRFLTVRGLVVEHVEQTSPRGGRPAHRYTPGSRSKPRGPSEQTSGVGGFPPTPHEVSSELSAPAPGCEVHRDDPRPGCRYCEAVGR